MKTLKRNSRISISPPAFLKLIFYHEEDFQKKDVSALPPSLVSETDRTPTSDLYHVKPDFSTLFFSFVFLFTNLCNKIEKFEVFGFFFPPTVPYQRFTVIANIFTIGRMRIPV